MLLTGPLLLAGCSLSSAQVDAGQDVKAEREFVQGTWLNTKRPPTVASFRGRVLVVHFFTFACSNCRANVPDYNRWHDQGVNVVGVHTPELAFERDRANVERALKEQGIKHPVLLDPDSKNWKAWGLEYWPTVFVIDKQGRVRKSWVGEFGYQGQRGFDELTALIKQLEKE